MDDSMLRALERRLSDFERTATRYRAGTVTATNPLAVALGGSSVAYTSVRSVGPVSIGDQVATVVWGNDLVILGRLGGAGGGMPAVVSTLPATPGDGQECYYQNAAMATAGIVWHFRYRSGGGTYKWEFIGGASWVTPKSGDITTASTSFVAMTSGPSITVPLAGDYKVELVSRHINQSATVGYSISSVFKDAVDTTVVGSFYMSAINGQDLVSGGFGGAITMTAGQVLTVKVQSASGTSIRYMTAAISLTPTKVN